MSDETKKPDAEQFMDIRMVFIAHPLLTQAFAEACRSDARLMGSISKCLEDQHDVPADEPFLVQGIMVGLAKGNKEPSRIVRASGPLPRNMKGGR